MEAYISSIILHAGSYVPHGWAECNGQLMQVMQNQALFSLIGVNYGGDGRSNFALPKLAAPAPGLRYIICLQGIYPQRD